jgi:hypothetical protein
LKYTVLSSNPQPHSRLPGSKAAYQLFPSPLPANHPASPSVTTTEAWPKSVFPDLYPMKTLTELKFDQIIKKGFHEILKSAGFKRKANNFYRQLPQLGQIINIQKSQWGSKNEISFTINTGIFVPEYWRGLSYNNGKEIPAYPTESSCLIRKRIGNIRHQHDTWYDVNGKTDEIALIQEMNENVHQYILPYFDTIKSTEDVLADIRQKQPNLVLLGRFILYGELKMYNEAKAEYMNLIANSIRNPAFSKTITEYARKYGLIEGAPSSTPAMLPTPHPSTANPTPPITGRR